VNGGIARTLKPKLSGDTFANHDSLFAVTICYSFIIMSPGSRLGSRWDPGGFFQVNGGIARTLPITATYDKIWKQKFMGNLVPIS